MYWNCKDVESGAGELPPPPPPPHPAPATAQITIIAHDQRMDFSPAPGGFLLSKPCDCNDGKAALQSPTTLRPRRLSVRPRLEDACCASCRSSRQRPGRLPSSFSNSSADTAR